MITPAILIWGDTLEILNCLKAKANCSFIDPDYDLGEHEQMRIHQRVSSHTNGIKIVFQKPENRWPVKPDQYCYWVKPLRTINPQVAYGRFVEEITLYGDRIWNTDRHWSQYYNVFFDALEETPIHPHQKPASLVRRFILNHTKRGDLILDAFSGSGVIVEQSISTGRSVIGIELDRKYVCLSVEKLIGVPAPLIDKKLEKLEPPVIIPVVGEPPLSKWVEELRPLVLELERPPDDPIEYLQWRSGPRPKQERKRRTKEQIQQGALNALARGMQQSGDIRSLIEEHFAISPNWETKTWQKTLEYIKKREAQGERVEIFIRWWFTEDWRGQDGHAPTANQIMELWPQAFKETSHQDVALRRNEDGSFN